VPFALIIGLGPGYPEYIALFAIGVALSMPLLKPYCRICNPLAQK
jgi:hypothetical protein